MLVNAVLVGRGRVLVRRASHGLVGAPAALEELRDDQAFAEAFGQEVVDWILTLKGSEVERYLAEVSDWEQREYFSMM